MLADGRCTEPSEVIQSTTPMNPMLHGMLLSW
jgi:hypothetical protein